MVKTVGAMGVVEIHMILVLWLLCNSCKYYAFQLIPYGRFVLLHRGMLSQMGYNEF